MLTAGASGTYMVECAGHITAAEPRPKNIRWASVVERPHKALCESGPQPSGY
jgi:hypothetical protein